jgi:hypothetical protein
MEPWSQDNIYHLDLPLRVCSYMRSGTALLCATLQHNFEGFPEEQCAVRNYQHDTAVWYKTKTHIADIIPWHHISLTHSEIHVAERHLSHDKMLYIVRNPKDVFRSLWKFTAASLHTSLNDFITRKLIAAWGNNVYSYTNMGIFTIYFEDLINPKTFLPVLERIRDHFDLTPSPKFPSPIPHRVGWHPIPEANIEEEYSEKTLKMFRTIIPAGFMRFQY